MAKPIRIGKLVLMVIVAVIFIFPVYWLAITSLKELTHVVTYPPRFLPVPVSMSGYTEALFGARGAVVFKNSLIIAVATTLIALLTGSFAAYSFARFNIGGFHLPFWILSTRMMPAVASIIPLFLLINKLGFIDTYPAVIIAHLVITLPFAVWMLRGFFMEIPVELEESAMIDGCSRLGALARIGFPLVAPGLAVTALFCFIFSWNEFMFALILTRREVTTLPVKIAGMHAAHGVLWHTMSAFGIIGIIPVVILSIIAQRYLVRGLTLGAIR